MDTEQFAFARKDVVAGIIRIVTEIISDTQTSPGSGH